MFAACVCMSMKWGEIGGTISTVKIRKGGALHIHDRQCFRVFTVVWTVSSAQVSFDALLFNQLSGGNLFDHFSSSHNFPKPQVIADESFEIRAKSQFQLNFVLE